MVILLTFAVAFTLQHALTADGRGCANNKPIIGILGQRLTSKRVQQVYPFARGMSYLHAGYVKWIESSGARVVLIKDGMKMEELKALLGSINGVVFPGGASNLRTSSYARTGRIIFDYAVNAKKKGEAFPLLGICLGFQLLTRLVARKNLLRRTDAKGISMPMQYTKQSSRSAMFGKLDSKMKGWIMTRPLTYNSHRWGIYPRDFNSNYRLRAFFNILSTSKDRKGIEFVAAMEAKEYPIYGVQWHPEKPSFEWDDVLNMDQSHDSILFSQFIGNFFVNESRKNCNRFRSDAKERLSLVYNHYPIYTGSVSAVEQMYLF